MIASVVVTLEHRADQLQDIIDEISRIPCVELGDLMAPTASTNRQVATTISTPAMC